jgi:hypothetical protein
MMPEVTQPYGGPLTLELLAPTAYIIRCLKDPKHPLGKYEWVCSLVTRGTTGFIKAFCGRKPKLSELLAITYAGGYLGLEVLEWEHLDEEGNLIVTKTMRCRTQDASILTSTATA